MATITTRAGKGSPLTNTEVDDNFTNLNTDKAELSGAAFTGNISVDRGNTSVYLTLTGGNPEIILNDTTADTNTCTIQNTDGSINYRADEDNESGNSRHRFFTDGTQRMEIEANGNVGIGTDTPASKLHIHQDSTDYSILKLSNSTTGFGASDGLSIWSTGNQAAVWNYEASPLLFGTSGTERMRINSSGNVGIGTTVPAAELHIADAAANAVMRIESSNSHQGNIFFDDQAATNVGKIGYDHSDNSLRFDTASTERMRIASSGNVGIGTINPTSTLHVKAATADLNIQSNDGQSASLTFGDATDTNRGGIEYASTDDLIFKNNNLQTRMVIRYTGNVGIGTSSPSEKLQVNGNIKIGDSHIIGDDGFDNLTLISSSPEGIVYGSNTDHIFKTGATGLDATGTERMRIDSSGNMTLGLTSKNSATTFTVTNNNGYASTLLLNQHQSGAASIAVPASENALQFNRFNGTSLEEAMRITSGGVLLVGKTDGSFGNTDATDGFAVNKFAFHQQSHNRSCADLNRRGTEGDIIDFYKDGTTVGSIGIDNVDNLYIEGNSTHAGLQFGTGSVLPHQNGSNIDSVVDIGHSGNRFKDIYRSGSTYSTSDRNKKQDIRDLTDAEARVATVAKGLLKAFRYIDSVEAEGDEANIHFGIIAQDLKAAFEAEGLNANDYQVFKTTTYTDDEGVEQTTYSICYENLLAFIIAAI